MRAKQFMPHEPYDPLPESAPKRPSAHSKNFVGGFNQACDEVIKFADENGKIDRPGVSGTEETHVGGYEYAMQHIRSKVEAIKKKGPQGDV